MKNGTKFHQNIKWDFGYKAKMLERLKNVEKIGSNAI